MPASSQSRCERPVRRLSARAWPVEESRRLAAGLAIRIIENLARWRCSRFRGRASAGASCRWLIKVRRTLYFAVCFPTHSGRRRRARGITGFRATGLLLARRLCSDVSWCPRVGSGLGAAAGGRFRDEQDRLIDDFVLRDVGRLTRGLCRLRLVGCPGVGRPRQTDCHRQQAQHSQSAAHRYTSNPLRAIPAAHPGSSGEPGSRADFPPRSEILFGTGRLVPCGFSVTIGKVWPTGTPCRIECRLSRAGATLGRRTCARMRAMKSPLSRASR